MSQSLDAGGGRISRRVTMEYLFQNHSGNRTVAEVDTTLVDERYSDSANLGLALESTAHTTSSSRHARNLTVGNLLPETATSWLSWPTWQQEQLEVTLICSFLCPSGWADHLVAVCSRYKQPFCAHILKPQ